MHTPEISIVISTYNQPKWLEKVLWGYTFQTFKNFEVLIADDGSTQETKDLITKIQGRLTFPIRHVWHPDNGFQKTIILNKATLQTKADYILYTDGDCIPRKDFLAVHMAKREKGYFLSGGYFKLPTNISQLIRVEDIESQRCFNESWLVANGLKKSIKNWKLTASGFFEKILNRLTPTNASWNGHNVSGWKTDIINANGYDERMQYGGEDRELGERLFQAGIKSKQLRYSVICVHLDHPRSYIKPEMLEKNLKIRKDNKINKRRSTEFGLSNHS